MAEITYEVVEHNGGFAYRVGNVFSETYATHKAAHEAAEAAAQRHHLSGTDAEIQYQDASGQWHEEHADGDERPDAEAADRLPADLEARDAHGRPLEEGEVPNPDRTPSGLTHSRQ